MTRAAGFLLLAVLQCCAGAPLAPAYGADPDGRWKDVPQHIQDWVRALRSRINTDCCALADGTPVDDWRSDNGKYSVYVGGQWFEVPDDSLIDTPNRIGEAIVWLRFNADGSKRVACFLPGAGT